MRSFITLVCLVLLVIYIVIGIMGFMPGKPLGSSGIDHLWIHTSGVLKPLSSIAQHHHEYIPPKVAVHITGVVRGSMASLVDNIVSKLGADVFINASGYSPTNPDCAGLNPEIVIDSSSDSTNTLTMFKRMDELQEEFDKYTMRTGKRYDVVIRTRPDILFRESLPNCVISLAASGVLVMFTKQHMKYIYNPAGTQMYTDTFFLSSPESMRAVHYLYREEKDSIEASALGEIVLTSFIRKLKLEVYVLLGFELLLRKMTLDRFSLGSFSWDKLKNHWPL